MTRRIAVRLSVQLSVACLAVGALVSCTKDEGVAPAPARTAAYDDATVALLNEAAGLMGKFEFEAAATKYAEAGALPSKPPEAALGRAIATLNQSREGAQEEALAMLGEFLATKPPRELELRARYCQGLCFLYLGRAGEAAAAFTPVAEARSTDAYALYFAAQALEQTGEHAKALAWYASAAERDPYLKSAELGIQRCARRLGDEARAEKALAAFERLAANPRARNAEFKYTRRGSLGRVVVPERAGGAPYTPPAGGIFEDAKELAIAWPEGFTPRWSNDAEQHAVTVDLDRDGRLDLLIPRALLIPSGPGTAEARMLVLMAAADGTFVAKPDHPLVELAGGGIYSLLCGDIDNDGWTDLYVCRSGDNRLLLADGGGGFRDATETAGVKGRGTQCIDGALADLDHDGDLDLFLCFRDAPNQLYINNLDGTFREIGREAGIATEDRFPTGVIVGDFDFDRDADILVLNETLPHECFVNDRLWKWSQGTFPGFSREQMSEATESAAVVELTDIPLRRFVLANPRYLRMPTRIEDMRLNRGAKLAVGDVTGDGHPDLLVVGADRIELRDKAGRLVSEWPALAGAMRTQLLTLDPLRGPELLTLRVDGAPLLWRAGTGRGPYAAIAFSGRTDPSQSMRSNASGIGTSYAARIGTEWFGGETFRPSTGRGQSLAPVSIGMGPFEAIDFVEIEWSDGVFQTEVNVAKGVLHAVTQTQRQISSCPVLFAWNGSDMRFVSDLLGVGGMGYLLAPGQYAESRPWEYFVLPEGALAPRADGTLSLTLAEPMEESCYLDSIRLRAVDLPDGWDIAPDERLSVGGPAPTGETVAWRRETERLPSGVDALAKADLVAVEPGTRDPRFLGRLVSEHVVELEFGTAIDAMRDPWLVIDGWVEYPYSQTMFAAWQAGADYRPPNLEARGADGAWVEVMPQWGYMAGMPRRMALPVPRAALPAGTTALRMRMNVELYLDSVRLVEREPLPAEPVELSLARASLASVGFAKWSVGPQRQPFYDRRTLLPLWDCRMQRGLYTAFGDVRELLARDDGALVVFGSGEEIAFDFAGPSAAAQPGTTRRFVLEVRGWCKDMDLFTRNGETVDPLPVQPADDKARELMAATRTRPAGGR
ncbi:MAG: FG-GAP-like repeat-containing protein [bacterium]